MPSKMAEKTAAKYRGKIADGYEDQRAGHRKWKTEDRIVRELLADLPARSHVLDVPFGTGRFFPYYVERQFRVTGLDISEDMLRQAESKLAAVMGTPYPATIGVGDIFNLGMADKTVDVAVSIRIMNLIDASDMQQALAELQRVARYRIIFNLRVWHPETKYRRPQRMETLLEALKPGWRIEKDIEIHEPDFRMFMLCSG